MGPVTYGYAWASKTDRDDKNLEKQLHIRRELRIRAEHVYADEMTGSATSLPARGDRVNLFPEIVRDLPCSRQCFALSRHHPAPHIFFPILTQLVSPPPFQPAPF